ncbi:Structural maintenance of chromosomes protein [Caligus rogercresseyi]|uniref:Structural maintenance of chromosomes protein n=1 Tax=Caligus rogercresseyi TaxID=217165 RepID=A0A7T8GSU4_CALRO|nr:Structural maintenance of chromosomes protein [Caligus rogercresseyi]
MDLYSHSYLILYKLHPMYSSEKATIAILYKILIRVLIECWRGKPRLSLPI